MTIGSEKIAGFSNRLDTFSPFKAIVYTKDVFEKFKNKLDDIKNEKVSSIQDNRKQAI